METMKIKEAHTISVEFFWVAASVKKVAQPSHRLNKDAVYTKPSG